MVSQRANKPSFLPERSYLVCRHHISYPSLKAEEHMGSEHELLKEQLPCRHSPLPSWAAGVQGALLFLKNKKCL